MKNIKIKLYFKLLVYLIIAVFLTRYFSNIAIVDKSNLHQLNVKLLTDMKISRSSTNNYVYKFWTTSFPVEFAISPNDLLKNNKSLIGELVKDDSLTIFIQKNNIEILSKKSKRVRVFQILKNGKEYLKDKSKS